MEFGRGLFLLGGARRRSGPVSSWTETLPPRAHGGIRGCSDGSTSSGTSTSASGRRPRVHQPRTEDSLSGSVASAVVRRGRSATAGGYRGPSSPPTPGQTGLRHHRVGRGRAAGQPVIMGDAVLSCNPGVLRVKGSLKRARSRQHAPRT